MTPRTAAIAALLLAGAPLAAQEETRVPTGVISGSLYGQVSSPRGDFGKNTGTGGGGGGTLIIRADRDAIFNLRTDLSFVTYGNSSRRIPLAGTGGLVRLDLRTSNNIVSLVTGPQLLGTSGAFTPYLSALGGFSVFWTQSSVQGTQQAQEPFASTTNSSDAALAYGGAGGVYIRVANGTRPVRLELGARVLRHDNVKYLNDQRVKEAFENERDPIPLRGRADFVTFYIGLNAFMY
ncbi:MAG TPA: hypothetical protein VE869_15600 [Gemmatimonas sp.]|nr:hypothetical protein [Gemmatimonas sp.]